MRLVRILPPPVAFLFFLVYVEFSSSNDLCRTNIVCVSDQKDYRLQVNCRNVSSISGKTLEIPIFRLPNSTRHLNITSFHYLDISKLLKDCIPHIVRRNLKNLHIPENRIKELAADTFQSYRNLIDLNISNNRICFLHHNTFHGLQKLVNLDLRNNDIKSISAGTFSPLIALQHLHLENNSLIEISNNTFANLDQLVELWLCSNQIERVDDEAFISTPKLEQMFMDDNKITNLSDAFFGPDHLKYLYLSRNEIQFVHLKNLSKVRQLQLLYIDDNNIRTVPATTWEALISIVSNGSEFNNDLIVGNNMWTCDCNIRPLAMWIRQNFNTGKNLSSISNMAIFRKSVPYCSTPLHLANRSLHEVELQMLYCYVPSQFCNANSSNTDCVQLQSQLCRLTNQSGSCVCQKESPCYVCPSGYYGPHLQSSSNTKSCRSCPPFSFTYYGMANTAADCQCKQGFYKTSDSCELCPQSNYERLGHVACNVCPNSDRISDTSSTIDNCTCSETSKYNTCLPFASSRITMQKSHPVIEDTHTYNEAPILVILIATGGAFFAAFIMLLLVHKYKKRYKLRDSCQITKPEMQSMIVKRLPKAVENYYVLSENWNALLVNLNQLKFEHILAHGAFGQVRKATATGLRNKLGPSIVAVKSLRDEYSAEDKDALFTELQQLLYVGHHPNIINLLGFVTVEDSLLLIMEFADNGDLLNFLKSKIMRTEYAMLQLPNSHNFPRSKDDQLKYPNTDNCIDKITLLSIAWQVSKGMSHLALMKCIHRDLAARNVLLNSEMVAKVSDFGLARAVYESGYYFKETKGRLPFKWMPPEAILEGHYTTKSDVWSFGVLLWEIFTLGGNPYPGVPINSLLDLLQSGYRMAKPNNCTTEVYNIMLMCWKQRANNRPSFDELAYQLDGLLQRASQQVYMVVENDVEDMDARMEFNRLYGYEQATASATTIGNPGVTYQNTSAQLAKNFI